MFLQKVVISLFLVLSIIACDNESSTAPTNISTRFSIPKVGTKVSFDLYRVFDSALTYKDKFDGAYSYKIEKQVDYDGKNALIYNYYDADGEVFDHEIYSYDTINKCIEMHRIYFDSSLAGIMETNHIDSLPNMVVGKWIKIADYKNDSWTVSNKDFKDFVLFGGKLSGNYKILGRKGSSGEMQINGKSTKYTSFILEVDLSGILNNAEVKGYKFSIKAKNEIFIADGIGKVGNILYPLTIHALEAEGNPAGLQMIGFKAE
jgi:hypothetical protein